MTAPKTRATKASVAACLAAIDDPGKRRDCREIARIMRAATGKRARMWGSTMVGFGRYDYRHASGQGASWFEVGFSPRARNITVYIMPGFSPFKSLMKNLGRYKTGKSCLYIQRLEDVDIDILSKLIHRSVAEMRRRYPG